MRVIRAQLIPFLSLLFSFAKMATMKRRNIPQGIEKQPSFSILDDEKDKIHKAYYPPPSPVTYSSNKVE